MTKPLVRTLAVLVTCAAALAGVSSASGAPTKTPAGAPAAKTTVTDYGFKANVYGTKLVQDNVEVRNLKDAYAQQPCTRVAGRDVVKSSALTTPDNPLIAVSGSTSRTTTYRANGRTGVRGVNRLADVELGDISGGTTPTLVIKGLTTRANSFHRTGGFGHAESIDFTSMEFGNLPDTIPAELQDLLDALGSTTGDVVSQVVDVLQQAGAPIEIPGLGTIGLGTTSGHAGAFSARSDASALSIVINADGTDQILRLGQASSRIGGPTPFGVFNSRAIGLDMVSLNGSVHLGNTKQRSIPCEGTFGKVRRYHVPSASVVRGVVVQLDDIDYALMGRQSMTRHRAEGFVATHIGKVTIPAANLELRDVVGRVAVRLDQGATTVKPSISYSVGKILVNGVGKAVPKPGHRLTFDGGYLETRILTRNRSGAELHAVRVTLTSLDSVIELGWAASHIHRT